MLEGLENRKKIYLLLAGFVVISIFAYNFSIKKTVDLYKRCNQLEEKIENSKSAKSKVAQMKSELGQLEEVIGKGKLSGYEVQSMALDKVNEYCSSSAAELVEVFPIHEFKENDYAISTNSFRISGDFLSLLKLNEEIEKKFDAAKVSAVHYERMTNRRTKRKKLYATFYIQNISEG